MSIARLAIHLVLAAAFVGAAMSARAAQFGDVSVLVQVPAPGFPEGIAAKGDRVLAFDGKGNVLVTKHAFATGLLLPSSSRY